MDKISPEELESAISAEIKTSKTLEEVESLRLKYFGKSGHVSEAFKNINNLPEAEKKHLAEKINKIKSLYLPKLLEIKEKIELERIDQNLAREKLDLTLPSRKRKKGSAHIISKTLEEFRTIFKSIGFSEASGPMIEDEFHNFEALNFPDNHPSKDMHDSFYLKSGKLLRTHTSTVQIRWMMDHKNPPYKIIAPGQVYRCDYDATHTPMFHQIEGLVVDKDLNMGDLKTCLEYFLKKFFDDTEIDMRMRPSFFPFTEPSVEVDIKNKRFGNKWLEVMGAGMVHPNVLRNVNIDPEIYRGFAFGMGVERMGMLKYQMTDLREFFTGDQRWTKNYNFSLNSFLG